MFFSQRAQVEMLIKDWWSLSAYLLFFKAELVSNTHLFNSIFMARLSLMCHFVGVSKNSTRQALPNLEALYECI